MRNTSLKLVLLSVLALPLLTGCGGSGKPAAHVSEGDGGEEATKEEIKKYDIAKLPAVDEPLPRSLDANRLEICPPLEWKVSPQANYLVAFAKGKVSALPRMTLTAADSPFGKDDTSAENVQELAKRIQRKLEKDGKKVREKTKPVKLGDLVWVRHVRQSSQGGTPCAVQTLQIIRDGRLYTLEVTSAAKDDSPASIAAAVNKDDVRLIAYSVAAHAKFIRESGGSPSTPPTEDETLEKGKAEPAPPAAEKTVDPQPDVKKSE